MAEIEFTYKRNSYVIQGNINEKMIKFCEKFASKIGEDINTKHFLYSGDIIKPELTFIEHANYIDKSRKKMNVFVIDIKNEPVIQSSLKSKEIIEKDEKLISFSEFDANIINNNSELVGKKKVEFNPYKRNYYYKKMKLFKYGEDEDLYIVSSYFGINYYLIEIKELSKSKKIIEGIKKYKSLNLKIIIDIPYYFNENDEEIFCVVMEYNKNLKYNKNEINSKALWLILIKIIFGLKLLSLNNIYIPLNNLDAKYIYFDENYDIKFDLISSEYSKNIKDNFEYFFETLIDIYKDNKEDEDNELMELYKKKITSLNEFINDRIFMKKFFESNLFNEISEIGDFMILLDYYNEFPNFFSLKIYKDPNLSVLLCQKCNSLLDIYLKDQKNILLKCNICNKIKNEGLNNINNNVAKSEKTKNNNDYMSYILLLKNIELNCKSLLKDCDNDIKEKYTIVKKIIDNLYENYQNKNNAKSLLGETISNILMNFFYDIGVQLNLFLFSKILYSTSYESTNCYKNSLKSIKNYFSKNKIKQFKDRIKKEEEKYLLFYDNLREEDIYILKKNIETHILSNNTREYMEHNLLFSNAIKKYITIKKILYPQDSININESLNNINNFIRPQYDYSYKNFILSLFGKCLEENGIEVYISKKENKEYNNLEFASLQALASFGNQKKYELHFDFGDKNENKKILYDSKYGEKFLKETKIYLSKRLGMSPDNIILTNIHHGCAAIDLIMLNSTKENEDQLNSFEQNNSLNIKRIKEKAFLDAIEISPKILDPLGDRIAGWGENETRGGEDYIPPSNGWIGIGLKVSGKYDNGDDSWLDYQNQNGEFAIAYLGLNNFLNDKKKIISDLNDITQNIMNLQKEKLYKNEKDIRDTSFFSFLRKKCGDGVCLFQNPDYAENCAGEIEINKFKIKIMLMCRVNPKKIRQPEMFKYCWILNPSPNEIRPYRILIKKIPTSALTGELNNKLITTNFPTNYVISAINSQESSFYNYSKKHSSLNELDLGENIDENFKNDISVMRLYTGEDYRYINNYLRSRSINYFKEKDLRSWTYCLQLALKRNINVKENTIVYRGINRKFPSEIGIGSKFYFREFFSTSIQREQAKKFTGQSGTLMTIYIKNNGVNGKNNYCYYIRDFSLNPIEDEVIISSHSFFIVIDIYRENNIDYVTLICEGYFNFKNIDENVYEGGYRNGKKDGFGIFYWNSEGSEGSIYKGFFKNDAPEGYGKMIWKKNYEIQAEYEGNWINNERNGFGIYTYQNGNKYKGEFVNDQRKGLGKFIWKGGDKYEGEFARDEREGFGVSYWKDGDKYEGEFKDSFRKGFGIFYYRNGDKYEGEINHGKEGIGVYYYSNGNKYEGEWKNNYKNGKGIFYLKNGNKYEGFWKNDRKLLNNYIKNEEYIINTKIYKNNNTNIIKITYIDGDIYEGEYDSINCIITGVGKYYFNNGNIYQGNFKDNKFEGKGELTLVVSNQKIIGLFNNGELNGKGTIYYENGDKMEGEWKNGQKEGIFIEVTKNKEINKYLYQNDKYIKSIE